MNHTTLSERDMFNHLSNLGLDQELDRSGSYQTLDHNQSLEYIQGLGYKLIHGDQQVIFVSPESFLKTVRRVEKKLNVTLFH